ncbi:MAG: hypothetical protein K5765_06875 [Clostridia bacterium]|nr:hypothetical protein [Clostridia bacterium]
MDGNEIEGIERYETGSKKKPVYDKVMKILGLVDSDLETSEKLDKIK